ncbi:MAG: PEP-CTERM sorting domain-containing protein [Syntrophobacteraceae bacterium]
MKPPQNIAILALGVIYLFLTTPSAFADTYHLATFTGGVYGGNANDQSPFSAIIPQSNPISGNFVIDDSITVPGSGYWNSNFSQYPDIANIPAATAFTINLGSLQFTLADALPGSGAVQYNNGQFTGFAFQSDFTYKGTSYTFDDEGGTWSIYATNTFQQYVSGYIGGMTLGSPYSPPAPSVPEPATIVLILSGLAGLAGYRKLQTA